MCIPPVQKAVDSAYKTNTNPEELLKAHFKLIKTTKSNIVEQLVTYSKNQTKTYQCLVLKIKSGCITQEF